MKVNVPPSPTGMYVLARSTVDMDFGRTNASVRHRMGLIGGRRKTRRHVGRALRRDYFLPVARELNAFQLPAVGEFL